MADESGQDRKPDGGKWGEGGDRRSRRMYGCLAVVGIGAMVLGGLLMYRHFEKQQRLAEQEEKAQEEFDHTKYKHRGVLILNKNKRVIGKLGQLDVLRALEPKEEGSGDIDELNRFGFSSNFVHKLRKQRRLKATPLKGVAFFSGLS